MARTHIPDIRKSLPPGYRHFSDDFLSIVWFSGIPSTAFLEISLVNATVERDSYYEIRAERFSPNITDTNFIGIVCGYVFSPGVFSPFTTWVKSSLNSMVLNTILPSAYRGRITIPNKTVMRIHNAEFSDEDTTFFCTLEFLKKAKFIEIHKMVKLRTVYGK